MKIVFSPDSVPAYFYDVHYDGSRYPGTPGSLKEGANCQKFAYELVRHYGRFVPDFRSSELWDDTKFTSFSYISEPLDLVLFNKNSKPWGAHVGVYLGANLVIHLAKEICVPAIWKLDEFAKRPQYACYIGVKRALFQKEDMKDRYIMHPVYEVAALRRPGTRQNPDSGSS
jgi:hypothetical protein